jgi:hypothetical protein
MPLPGQIIHENLLIPFHGNGKVNKYITLGKEKEVK